MQYKSEYEMKKAVVPSSGGMCRSRGFGESSYVPKLRCMFPNRWCGRRNDGPSYDGKAALEYRNLGSKLIRLSMLLFRSDHYSLIDSKYFRFVPAATGREETLLI